jgi:hypothetical protein
MGVRTKLHPMQSYFAYPRDRAGRIEKWRGLDGHELWHSARVEPFPHRIAITFRNCGFACAADFF